MKKDERKSNWNTLRRKSKLSPHFLGSVLAGLLVATGTASATEISFWTNLTTASQANVIKKQIDECTANQPDLKVNFETVPFGAMYTRLITALRNDDAPNIMNTIEGAVAFMQAKGGLEPVTDVVDVLGRDDFTASYLKAVSKNGEIWGIPDWALHQSVWYRKDLFDAAGIDVPKSWEELLVAAKTLTKPAADGSPAQYGFAVPMSRSLVAPQTYFQIFYSAGGSIFDPETGEYVFDDYKPVAVESLDYMIELYKEASPPASIEWSWSEYRTAFVKGLVAMTNEWGAVVQMASEQNPSVLASFDVFPFPGPSAETAPAASLGGGYYYLVGKSSPDKVEASKDLLRCFYEPERVAERANSRPVFAIPATKSAFESTVYQSNETVQQFQPQLNTIFNEVMPHWYRYGMEAGLNPLAGQIEATTFIGDAIQNAVLGNMTSEEAIDRIATQLNFQVELLSQ